jgi:hypothetical protein
MVSTSHWRSILSDEAVTRGLGDPEARVLVEWLVEQADAFAARLACPKAQATAVQRLCRRARAISRFVRLWCHEGAAGAACQLAATERFAWPLPRTPLDPCELMHEILCYEAEVLH